ncbi:hypothetical protein M0804_001694 [Polistes exclamans]|nr:hypothetical protein M0804_001694 [Polistes exclamans]
MAKKGERSPYLIPRQYLVLASSPRQRQKRGVDDSQGREEKQTPLTGRMCQRLEVEGGDTERGEEGEGGETGEAGEAVEGRGGDSG